MYFLKICLKTSIFRVLGVFLGFFAVFRSVFRVFRQFEELTLNLISGGYYNAKEEPKNQM